MPKEITYGGKTYRNYRFTEIWACSDGSVIRRIPNNYMVSGFNHYRYKPKMTDGHLTFLHDGERIRIDIVVATCFCPPQPRDGYSYEIYHRDGNEMNCASSNLGWRKASKVTDPKTGLKKVRLWFDDNNWIDEAGNAYVGDTPMHHSHVLIDADTDLAYYPEPSVQFGYKGRRGTVDSLMKAAGFVSGDPTCFNNPVILHKDYDFDNFAADNLEWCENDDPRFKEYQNIKHSAMQQEVDRVNSQQRP